MSPLVILAILGTIIVTATLSGILGMGGGIILMGALAALIPLPAAMMLHGTTQLAANGSRAILHRRYIVWKVALPFSIGAVLITAAMAAVRYVPSLAVVYILLGAFPFLARLMPARARIDILRRNHAVVAGAVVTGLQLVAGASGPILDAFFLSDKLSRHQVVATKALTQCFGHALKIFYYGGVIGAATAGIVPTWLNVAAIALAVIGTIAGGGLLERMSDARFRMLTKWMVMGIGVWYCAKGIALVWAA